MVKLIFDRISDDIYPRMIILKMVIPKFVNCKYLIFCELKSAITVIYCKF